MSSNYVLLNKEALSKNAELVVVSKTRTNEEIMSIYDLGHRIFGENRVNDFLKKKEELPDDIKWHFIGHLQSKKVKSIINSVDLIHSIDSIKLLDEVQKQAKANNIVVRCLLQLKIAQEDSKYGFNEEQLYQLIDSEIIRTYDHISFCGLMGMATFTDDEEHIRIEFKALKETFDACQLKLENHKSFNILSMGMSGDYHLALEEGSTMLRVGSLVFN